MQRNYKFSVVEYIRTPGIFGKLAYLVKSPVFINAFMCLIPTLVCGVIMFASPIIGFLLMLLSLAGGGTCAIISIVTALTDEIGQSSFGVDIMKKYEKLSEEQQVVPREQSQEIQVNSKVASSVPTKTKGGPLVNVTVTKNEYNMGEAPIPISKDSDKPNIEGNVGKATPNTSTEVTGIQRRGKTKTSSDELQIDEVRAREEIDLSTRSIDFSTIKYSGDDPLMWGFYQEIFQSALSSRGDTRDTLIRYCRTILGREFDPYLSRLGASLNALCVALVKPHPFELPRLQGTGANTLALNEKIIALRKTFDKVSQEDEIITLLSAYTSVENKCGYLAQYDVFRQIIEQINTLRREEIYCVTPGKYHCVTQSNCEELGVNPELLQDEHKLNNFMVMRRKFHHDKFYYYTDDLDKCMEQIRSEA